MEYIKVTKENLESEHICCAISNNRDTYGQEEMTYERFGIIHSRKRRERG